MSRLAGLVLRVTVLASLLTVFLLTPTQARAKSVSNRLDALLLGFFFLLTLPFTLLRGESSAYAETSSSFHFQTYVQSTNMINPTSILDSSGAGASNNCFYGSCWNIRVSNPQVTGIPTDAIIKGARVTILGTAGQNGYVQVLMGKNATYCLISLYVGDKTTIARSSNDVLTISNTAFSICSSPDGFPSSVSDLSNFFLEIRAAKSFSPATSYNFINPLVAFDYTLPVTPTPTVTPTSTPTPTHTPTPAPPEPFLDLPWDYESQGFTFKQVAFNPGSWFDHEYPLQNFCCEPPVMNYTGEIKNDFYRSHSGYDYNSQNGVFLNTLVLAAASGWATFEPEAESGGAGNLIKIDHENGYQTWYEHLAPDGLIVSSTGGRVFVDKGQPIGKVGMTGRTTGPHIHLSVFKDANDNDTFGDDYPWGFTDPLGWEGEVDDPWTLWESGGRNGTISHNLFIARAPKKVEQVPTTGGSITFEDIIIDILNGTFDKEVKIIVDHGPFESASQVIKSIMPSVFLDAFDTFGQKITQLLQPVTITYDYSDADLLNINENSLKIYWFNEETNQWEALPTILDTENKKVSAETAHFSQFALMGEVKDLIPPTTEMQIIGEEGEDGWYRSDVIVELDGQDNDGGVGLLYTLYTLNGGDWFKYDEPIVVASEGAHTVTYQSFDRADNKEERKTVGFSIDKTSPEAEINYAQETNTIEAIGKDGSESASVTWQNAGTGNKKIVITDRAGNTLTITVRTLMSRLLSWINIQSLQYNTDIAFVPDKNNLLITPLYNLKTGKVNSIGEVYSVKDKNVIGILYTLATDKTKIYAYDRTNKQLLKEELDGMHLLQLSTERGTLRYRY